jgi:hypothetical protein
MGSFASAGGVLSHTAPKRSAKPGAGSAGGARYRAEWKRSATGQRRVYLQDQKSQEVRTYITEANGHYRFGQLSTEVDYQLWAEYKGHKSKTRSISSFDSKKEFNFDLKIDTAK